MTYAPPTITASDLCFGYTTQDVLHDIHCQLHPGELTAIAGPNGSGKSTLVELLAGLHTPRQGKIQRRGTVALVVQHTRVPDTLPVTVRDVIAMGTWSPRSGRRDRTGDVARCARLVSLEDLLHRPFNALSGGQRQRALLAQGLIQQAPTLLLDEPAAGLDTESRKTMHEILRHEADRGTAVCLVSHDQDSLELADRVIRLESGRLLAAH